MWELALEILGKGQPVPYERCVQSWTGRPPEKSRPEEKGQRVTELLARAGYLSSHAKDLLSAADAWRRDRTVPMASVRALGAAQIAYFDRLGALNLAYLPPELRLSPVPI